jgi:hypothetical protein
VSVQDSRYARSAVAVACSGDELAEKRRHILEGGLVQELHK